MQIEADRRRWMQADVGRCRRITMTSVEIEPITQFPNREPIPAEYLLRQGRALARWEPSGEEVGRASARAAGTLGTPGAPGADGDLLGVVREVSPILRRSPAAPGAPGDLLGASASTAGSRLSGNAGGASDAADAAERAERDLAESVRSFSAPPRRPTGSPGASDAADAAERAERDLVELVRAGKHKDGRFDDRLVDAAAELIQSDWKPSPPPRWVTYVRSLRHPTLTPDYAERLASKLGLPCLDVIAATREVEPQKAMPDPFRRCENVAGVFEVSPSVRLEPVLLFDDIVSSGWTLTSAGMSLRQAGVSVVHPFVLADFSEMAGVCRFTSGLGFTSAPDALGYSRITKGKRAGL